MVIVNYESAYREPLGGWLKQQRWDLLVMDESHRLKNPAGATSHWAARVAERSRSRLALTGTPMPHSPLDLYAQYRAVDQSVFGNSYQQFKNRYAEFEIIPAQDYRAGIKAVSGYRNLDELNEKFYQLAFRVTAAETLDLPPVIETYARVNLGARARRLYADLAQAFHAELDSGERITAANALAKLLRFQQLTSGFAVTAEGKILQVDDAKERALTDLLEDLPRREPVVVFARFREDLESIARTARKLGRPHHEISGRVKDLAEWQQKGGVLAVQIQAGGLGLDLTAARHCVYYSLGFSLGDYLQSVARLHRPGQRGLAHYVHLTAAQSIDEIIVAALADKEDVVQRILDTRDLTNGSRNRSG